MKKIVIPGDRIADHELRLPHTYIENGATYAEVIGMLDETGKFTSLETKYIPQQEDIVAGIVIDVKTSGYIVDINTAHRAFISGRESRVRYNIGDMVIAKTESVAPSGEIDLFMARRLGHGRLITFPPAKIPRLIGKQSSMLNMIKQATGGDIAVGNNGYIWLSEECDNALFIKAAQYIIDKAHTSGLTDQVAELLNNKVN